MPGQPVTPAGEALIEIGWTGKFRDLGKLARKGPLVIRRFAGDEWIEETADWWEANGEQVSCADHRPAVPWPDKPIYQPSIWRNPQSGKVVVLDEQS